MVPIATLCPASSREISWSWSVYKIRGANATTTITSGGGSVAWADITSKPTTISGFGITDAVPGSRASTVSA